MCVCKYAPLLCSKDFFAVCNFISSFLILFDSGPESVVGVSPVCFDVVLRPPDEVGGVSLQLLRGKPGVARELDVVLTVSVPGLRDGLVDENVLDPAVTLQLRRFTRELLADVVDTDGDFLTESNSNIREEKYQTNLISDVCAQSLLSQFVGVHLFDHHLHEELHPLLVVPDAVRLLAEVVLHLVPDLVDPHPGPPVLLALCSHLQRLLGLDEGTLELPQVFLQRLRLLGVESELLLEVLPPPGGGAELLLDPEPHVLLVVAGLQGRVLTEPGRLLPHPPGLPELGLSRGAELPVRLPPLCWTSYSRHTSGPTNTINTPSSPSLPLFVTCSKGGGGGDSLLGLCLIKFLFT